jgi:DNA-binding ferritin-like protein
MGRRTISATTLGRATTAARGVGRSMKETEDIERAQQTVKALEEQQQALEADLKAEIATIEAAGDPATETFERITIKPKRANVNLKLIALVWTNSENAE